MVNGWGLEIVCTIFELSFLKSWFEELEENGKTCQDTVVFFLAMGRMDQGLVLWQNEGWNPQKLENMEVQLSG